MMRPSDLFCSQSCFKFIYKGISRTLGKKGIRINGVSPGNILFEGSVWDKKLKEEK